VRIYHLPFAIYHFNRKLEWLFYRWKLENEKWKITPYTGGQALITLLFYVIIVLTVTAAAVILVSADSLSASKLQDSSIAYSVAEAGMENGILRLLRDPNYTGESNVTIGTGIATITVTPGSPITIVSSGTAGAFTRKVQVTVTYSAGTYTISSWTEIP
jgi:Tfp pilus assembly protein PilX